MERICPDCRSRHYARCDEMREDGKHHPGSILRCIECKTTYLDPALAASPDVAKLVADAEARGMERAAGIAQRLCPVPAGGPFSHTNSMRVVAQDIEKAIRAEAAAIRRAAEETGT